MNSEQRRRDFYERTKELKREINSLKQDYVNLDEDIRTLAIYLDSLRQRKSDILKTRYAREKELSELT